MTFWTKLRDSSLPRIIIIYLGGLWGLIEVYDFLIDRFQLPEKYLLVILIIGISFLPFASSFAIKSGKKARIQTVVFACCTCLALVVSRFSSFGFIVNDSPAELLPIEKSIAVLPFADMSPDHDQEYFSDGLSEEILNIISKVPDLKVIARTSAFSFKGKNEDVRTIAKTLGVTYVLTGAVRKSGDRLRISAQLVEAVKGTNLWSETFDRKMDDIFKIQDEISREVTNALKISFFNDKEISPHPLGNSEAYSLYLLGKYHMYRYELAKAIEYLRASVKLDSSFAKAWSTLAQAEFDYAMTDTTIPISNMYKKLDRDVKRALSIDSSDPHGLSLMAWFEQSVNFDYGLALSIVDKGLQVNPNNFDLLLTRQTLYEITGELDRAAHVAEKLVKVDPVNSQAHVALGSIYWNQEHYGQAKKEMKIALSLAPNNVYIYHSLGLIEIEEGKFEDALLTLNNDKAKECHVCRISSSMAYFGLGKITESDSVLHQAETNLQKYSSWIAYSYSYRKDFDNAFKWIEVSFDHQDMGIQFIKTWPAFSNLKTDPRYAEVLERLNLTD